MAMPRARILRGPGRVLVVSTDRALARFVQLTLNHGVYATKAVGGTAVAIDAVALWKPHLVVVDIDRPDDDGLDLVRSREERRDRLPLIALTKRGDLKTKLAAFEAGVDDIVTVPFSPEELVARVLALMRRTYGDEVPFVPVITVAGLKIDLLNQRVRSGSSTLRMTAMEQALLYFLASNPGETMTREQILDQLWGPDYLAESNLVDRHVRNLRAKLKDDWRQPRYIATVPGKGYRFIPAA
ncbi:MAG: response regulator transcription factor [Chloroflexi bacterium]|nr:MAG: response regulator transcription factor [Chloroflexota bacterium]